MTHPEPCHATQRQMSRSEHRPEGAESTPDVVMRSRAAEPSPMPLDRGVHAGRSEACREAEPSIPLTVGGPSVPLPVGPLHLIAALLILAVAVTIGAHISVLAGVLACMAVFPAEAIVDWAAHQ